MTAPRTKDVKKAPSTIERLAEWSASLKAGDIPEVMLEQAKLLLLDTIGCGIAGWEEESARDVAKVVEAMSGAPQCQVIGSKTRTNVPNAILANGVLCRVLDLNDYVIGDTNKGAEIGGHPSDNIPPALALAEYAGSTGRDLLSAIVVAYEIYGRCRELMERHSPWDNVTISGLVVPAIAGRLLSLDRGQIANAMGLSLARSATASAVRSGDMSAAKSIANALVAQNGAQAALLAREGVTGPLALFEQPRGMQTVFPKAEALAGLTAPLDAQSFIMWANVKAFPCLATGQSVVAAGLALNRAIGGNSDRITSARVVMSDMPTIIRQQNDPGRLDPNSRESADHSFGFLAAVSIIDGEFGLKQFEGERWNDQRVRALMGKLEMANDPAFKHRAPNAYPCRIEAKGNDGQAYAAEVPFPPGFSKAGLDAQTVIEKFTRISRGHMGRSACRRIVDAVMEIDGSNDCGVLAKAITR